MFPEWSGNLRHLYWGLRMARHVSIPSPRTWQRRIVVEKKRLLAEGVDFFDLHAVCTLLRRGEHSAAAVRAARRLERQGN